MAKNGIYKASRNYQNSVVFLDGKPIGQELELERLAVDSYGYNSNTRYESVLSRYDSRSGTLNEKYLDYNQTLQLRKLQRVLELQGHGLGEFVDWLAQQAVIRPSAGQSIHSVSNYLLQNFFIDVSARGAQDGLFNNLVAEGIQVVAELITDCVAVKIVEAGDPEKLIRQGFESVANVRGGAFNIQPVDQFFDDIEGAIEQAIQNNRGQFKGVTAAGGAMYGEVGKYLAREMKKDRALMQKLQGEVSPELTLELYEFIQKRLARLDIQMNEPPEVAFARENLALKNRIAEYEKTTNAGKELAKDEKPLEKAREAGNWWSRLTSGFGKG